MGTSGHTLRVIVAVDPDRFDAVVAGLTQAGLAVEAEWPVTGTLAGTVTESLLPAVRAVDGVVSVEPEQTFRIAPPGSAVQ
jgi:hypothetical protein